MCESQSPKSGQLHSNEKDINALIDLIVSQSPKSGQLHSNPAGTDQGVAK